MAIDLTTIRKKLFSPASYSIGSTLALQGFALLGFMLLVRMISIEQMGLWAIWLALIAIADMSRQGLVRNGLIRFSLQNTEGQPEWQSAGLVLDLLMTLLLSPALMVGGLVLASMSQEPSTAALAWWAFPFCLLQGLGRYAETIQIARSDFQGIFWANTLNGTLQFGWLMIYFLEDEMPTFGTLIGIQCAGIAVGLVFTLFYRSSYFRFGKIEKEKCLALFHFGKYVAGTNFLSLLFQRLDTLLISIFLTPAAVAVYNVATRLNGLLDLPLNGFSQALYPRIASEVAGSSSMQDVYGKNVRQLLWVQTPLTLILVLVAPFLVRLLAGEAYLQAVPLFQLLGLAGLVKPWGRTFGMTLDALGKSDFNFKLLLLSMVVNLSFSLLLMPVFGIVGAAVATGCGTVTTIAIGQFYLRKKLAVRPWSF